MINNTTIHIYTHYTQPTTTNNTKIKERTPSPTDSLTYQYLAPAPPQR